MQPLPDKEERRPGGTERRSNTSAAGTLYHILAPAQGAQQRYERAAEHLLELMNRNFVRVGPMEIAVPALGEVWSWYKFRLACARFGVITIDWFGVPYDKFLAQWWICHPRSAVRMGGEV